MTFIKILARHSRHFAGNGIKLSFSNYVDFGLVTEYNVPPESTLVVQPKKKLSPEIFIRIKRSIRGRIARHPFFSFLLFLSTLGVRGLVVACKARRYDEPNCVHFYQDFLTASFGCFLHNSSARRVIILHSGDDALSQLFSHYPGMIGTRYESFVRNWFDWTLRRQQAIVALSESYANYLQNRYPAQDVRCIYNTSPFSGTRVAESVASNTKDQIKLIAVGTLQFRKGFDLLIKAIALIPYYDREKLMVTIVGGGPAHRELEKLIEHHQLSHIITLVGESNNVAEFLAASDVYILTSRDEGLPISLIEACSFGLPIITTAVGAIPEIFDENSCYLVEAKEASIAEALVSLCRWELDLNNLSWQSQRIFNSKLSMEKFLDSYVNLLSGK